MSVKWKVCNECGKKVNDVASKCPYCNSSSFKEYEFINDTEFKSKKENYYDSKRKIKEEFNKFSNNAKKTRNDFLYENLPKDYADKLINDFSKISKSTSNFADEFLNENEYLDNFKKGVGIFSESTKKKSEEFINERISEESQNKIKQKSDGISNSTKRFVGQTSTVLTNIHNHQKKRLDKKREIKRQEREKKKKQKEAENKRKKEEREAERRKKEEEQKRKQEKINKNHEIGIGHLKKAIKYFDNNDIEECHNSLNLAFDYLKNNSPEYAASKLYYATTFLEMTNAFLAENPPLVYPVLDGAVKQIKIAVKSYDKNNSYCTKAYKAFKNELFFPIDFNYFNLDFSTQFGQHVAGGWLMIAFECSKIDKSYTLEKFRGDLYGRTGHHDMAVLCFEEALKSPNCDFRVWGYKAQSLKALGRIHEANACFSQLSLKLDAELRKDPNNIYLLREKAVTLASMGLKDRAIMVYNQILDIDPSADFVKEDIDRLRYM